MRMLELASRGGASGLCVTVWSYGCGPSGSAGFRGIIGLGAKVANWLG
jgi:hypothetical protein